MSSSSLRFRKFFTFLVLLVNVPLFDLKTSLVLILPAIEPNKIPDKSREEKVKSLFITVRI